MLQWSLLLAGTCLTMQPSTARLTKSTSVIPVIDTATNSPVILVGTMHYNPASVSVVESTIRAVSASEDGLRNVAIELCDARWNSTIAARWSAAPSLRRYLSEDEFQVAFETARACGAADIVLADQPIRITARRFGEVLLRTGRDCVTPSGWRLIGRDLASAFAQAPSFARAALDAGVVAGAPIALTRYLYQSPAALPFLVGSTVALTAAQAWDEATGATADLSDSLITALVSTIVARAVFVALIQERNFVLTENIRRACESSPAEDVDASTCGPGRAVVAVMGMAHLEGVRLALEKTER